MSEKSELGVLVDSPIEDFEKEIEKHNIGYLVSLRSILVRVYSELNSRQEVIVSSKTIPIEEKEAPLRGLFSEMLKVEEKVISLDKRIAKLGVKTPFDTAKH